MLYGKFESNTFVPAPYYLHIRNAYVFNPTDEQYMGEGYKPLVNTAMPEPPEGYTYESHWEEQEDSIIQAWTLVEAPPEEPTSEEILSILLGGTS